MTLEQLLNRVTETIGMEIVTAESLLAAITNCYADLRSRGYRQFKEVELTPITLYTEELLTVVAPTDLRKTMYCKVVFDTQIVNAARASLASKYVRTRLVNGEIRSYVSNVDTNAIYYINDGVIYVEWVDPSAVPQHVLFGYYQNLQAPTITVPAGETEVDLSSITLDIRPEFDDALVFYACYFYYARAMKDTEKIQLFDNRYKYYIEDILYELSAEDRYNEDDQVKVDGD